jgi:hypothetical protein
MPSKKNQVSPAIAKVNFDFRKFMSLQFFDRGINHSPKRWK